MSNNSQVIVTLIIGFVTFIGSVSSAAFISGMRWGRVNEEIVTIDKRLARIEGMFTLQLKDGGS
jgi:hypothetical protein